MSYQSVGCRQEDVEMALAWIQSQAYNTHSFMTVIKFIVAGFYAVSLLGATGIPLPETRSFLLGLPLRLAGSFTGTSLQNMCVLMGSLNALACICTGLRTRISQIAFLAVALAVILMRPTLSIVAFALVYPLGTIAIHTMDENIRTYSASITRLNKIQAATNRNRFRC